jgi:uncharacterized cysteine cluster protein YcgN (CxxCxxCC family)
MSKREVKKQPKTVWLPKNCPKLALSNDSNEFFKSLAGDLEKRHPQEKEAYERVIGIVQT